MGIYNLNGSQIQFISGMEPNNVDIKYNFPLGGERVAVVCFSDRNDNSIGVYKVNPATPLLENAVVAGSGIDAVSNTDGIDVVNFPLGSLFPSGLFIAQDGVNDNGNQNFKLVPWQAIANSISPALAISTTWDPRQVGAEIPSAPAISSFLPARGQVGTEVTIRGIRFTGATAVVFNATPAASFTVDSDIQIRAVVPPAAATGKISVSTPRGTATSIVDYTVIQLVAPNSPAQLSGNATSSTAIELAWNDKSDNEDGFKIERRTTGAFAEIATVGPNVTDFSDHGLAAGTKYTYRVRAFNNIGNSTHSNEASATTAESGGTEKLPNRYELKSAYPNPFNSQTTIQFALPQRQNVKLQIFNSLGQLVRTLSDGVSHVADNHTYQWDGSTDDGLQAPTGIYYVRLNAGPMHATRKLSLIKK